MSLKASLLVRSEALGLFVNILTVDDMYSRHNKENVWQPIQMQLSKKPKVFFTFLFLKFIPNFKHFGQKR